MEKVLIFGASRGLGLELAKIALVNQASVTGVSRSRPSLVAPQFTFESFDLSQPTSGQEQALRLIDSAAFSRIFYVAGGGPYGKYQEHAWRSHDWAWQTTFLACARMLHAALKQPPGQFIAIGSAVAEEAADPNAASYASAKHALKGLILSTRAEAPAWDVRLFSPGYMDTALLPAHAAVRQLEVWSPQQIARELWDWSLTNSDSGHKVYTKHPRSLS